MCTFEHGHDAPFWNQDFIVIRSIYGVYAVYRSNHQAAFPLGFLTKTHGAGYLSKNGRFFGLARFEQVRNPRQTPGDVTSLRSFLGNPCDYITNIHGGAVFEADDGIGWQEVMCWDCGTR